VDGFQSQKFGEGWVLCGRYSLSDPALMQAVFDIELSGGEKEFDGIKPRYNIAPSQVVPVVVKAEGKNRLLFCRWGFVPDWGKQRIINARAETVDKKTAFKKNLLYRRCLVPADGYYEWKKTGERKKPYRITAKDGSLLSFAGLWGYEKAGEDQHEPYSFVVITTAANRALAAIHDRMPAILVGDLAQAWLDGTPEQAESLKGLLQPFPEELLFYYQVSPLVNSPANDSPDCLKPVR